ncbi:MAG TPA: GyrI-like domain-containing protein [Streptosporangiaceae bacterium]|jgi:DNA gyrase inhibitor GyrI
MSQHAEIQQRDEQPYVGIRTQVPMDGIAGAVDQAFPALFGWLGQRDIAPAGAPFIRYHVIDMMASLDIEMGVPVAAPIAGDDSVTAGALPAGRYVVLRHVGHYDGLIDSNAELQRWARQQAVALESRDTPQGDAFAGRFEQYLTNPAEEPDPAKWQVDVAYLIA